MTKSHSYTAKIVWTGDRGEGTASYHGYDRTWDIETEGKRPIHCSNDPLLGGDPTKVNPEDLLLSSLSACHMLWYLHLSSKAGVVVYGYSDSPLGVGETSPNGAGRFLSVTLRPVINLRSGTNLVTAKQLHADVHQYCFIERSVNFPVACEATYIEV
jgi:organic hydroperoxide reductase OsmC/OhrA